MCIVVSPKEARIGEIDTSVLQERAGEVFDNCCGDVFRYICMTVGYEEAEQLTPGVFYLWSLNHASMPDCKERAKLECMKIARRAVLMKLFGHEDAEAREAVATMGDLGLGPVLEEELAKVTREKSIYEGLA